MIYEVRFSSPEIELLSGLKGENLWQVSSDGWAYHLRSDNELLLINVFEEATPDNAHPMGDVTRPQVQRGEGAEKYRSNELERPALITQIEILQTVVTMSPPKMMPKIEILGVEIPEGIGYGPLFIHPRDPQLTALETYSNDGNDPS